MPRMHPELPVPDILLLDAERQTRALLRAQLTEEGYEVAAFEAWPVPRRYYHRGLKPRAAIVDLQGLPEPERVLSELPALVSPARAIVIAALGTVPADRLRSKGFQVVTRPATIAQIVAAAAQVLKGELGS